MYTIFLRNQIVSTHTFSLLMPFHPVQVTLSLLLPFHPVPVTLSLLLPSHPVPVTPSHCYCPSPRISHTLTATALQPVPVTLSLLLPFHPVPDTHSHCYCPSTLYQLHSHCYCPSSLYQLHSHCHSPSPSTSHTLTATSLQPVPVTFSMLLPFHPVTDTHCHCYCPSILYQSHSH